MAVFIRNLMQQKTRTLATMLAVALGVTTFLSLRGVFLQFARDSEGYLTGLGSPDLISIEYKPNLDITASLNKKFSFEEYRQLRKCGYLATPQIELNWLPMSNERGSLFGKIIGADADNFAMFPYPLAAGRYFTQQEVDTAANVTVIGKLPAKTMFPQGDAVGKFVTIGGMPFCVVGVSSRDYPEYVKLAKKYGSLKDGGGNCFMVGWLGAVIPYTSAQVAFQRNYEMESLYLQAQDAQGCLNTLRVLHPQGDYRVETQRYIFEGKQKQLQQLSRAFFYVGALSTLISGLGIVSVMLIGIRQRQPLIGITQALGASPSYIFKEALYESLVIAIVGTACGVGLTLVVLRLILLLLGISAVLTGPTIAEGVGFCLTLCVVAGVYPAWKAANSKPLRSLNA